MMPDTASADKQYVRTLLFSMRANTPLARLHLLTKLAATLLLSLVLVRGMDMDSPDPAMVVALLLLSLLPHLWAGTLQWVFRSYLVLIFFMLLTLFINWIVFNPDPGSQVFYRWEVYHGYIPIGISLSLVAFLVAGLVTFRFTKGVFTSLVVGLAALALVKLCGLEYTWTWTRIDFFHPLDIYLSDKNILVAVTKVGGYAAMVFLTLMLVMTVREFEFVGVLCQLGLPFRLSFFISLALRSISTAMLDYETIVQAQKAKGIGLQKRPIWQQLKEFAFLAVPLVATMFRRASEIGPALLARGFHRAKKPTPFHETMPFRLADWAVMILCLALVLLVYAWNFNLTRTLGWWVNLL
ncbi:energy-coupling factor transporter transmembrane component T [Moorellaceae bacterium AZ2]